MKISSEKYRHLQNLSTEDGIINALAMDQRGSLKKMLNIDSDSLEGDKKIVKFKCEISKILSQVSSGILLDPEYGIKAAEKRAKHSGLIMAYEKTGYDVTQPGRMPDLLAKWSVRKLKNLGVDAIKFMLYYNPDDNLDINEKKQAFVERIGDECKAEDIPFFLELVTYDNEIKDVKSKEYAKIKPHKVITTTEQFSHPRFNVDVLKLEVPVNQLFVSGYTDKNEVAVYSKREAMKFYKEQSQATNLPFIFLSAGVTAELFKKELFFAKESESNFNGVLCGRATWKPSIELFNKNPLEGNEWLKNKGRENVLNLEKTLKETATPWYNKVQKFNS